MAIRDLYLTATNTSGIKEIVHKESYGQASSTSDVIATTTTLNVGDTCTIDLGYADEHAPTITNGVVKKVVTREPEHDYVITVCDKMISAVDYFMASDNPQSPFMADNISGEQLVINLLAQAGITGVIADATGFTFAVQSPKAINLISAWDAVDNICRICGFIAYADAADGSIHFTQRKPYIMGGDASIHTFTRGNTGDILNISYAKSDEKLRNKVTVYGAPGIFYSASAVSPYLPSNFYKTLLVSHELIDSLAQAIATANVNLTMFNRLTETCRLATKGIPSIHSRSIVDVTEPFTGLSAGTLWFTFGATHTITQSGYQCDLTLTK